MTRYTLTATALLNWVSPIGAQTTHEEEREHIETPSVTDESGTGISWQFVMSAPVRTKRGRVERRLRARDEARFGRQWRRCDPGCKMRWPLVSQRERG